MYQFPEGIMKLWKKRFIEYFDSEFKEYEFKHYIAEQFFEEGYRKAMFDVYYSIKDPAVYAALGEIFDLADTEVSE